MTKMPQHQKMQTVYNYERIGGRTKFRGMCACALYSPSALTRSSMGQIKIQALKIFEASAVIQPLRQAVKNEIKMNAQKL